MSTKSVTKNAVIPFSCSRNMFKVSGDITGLVGSRPFAWHLNPRAERPVVCALDIGEVTGVAVVGPTGPDHDSDFVDNIAGKPLSERWQEAVEDCICDLTSRNALIVVEDVFLHEGKRRNVDTTIKLAYAVGAVVAICLTNRFPVLRVKASVWQRRMLGQGITREQGKKLSLAVARQLRPDLKVKSDHESDALLMASYVLGPLHVASALHPKKSAHSSSTARKGDGR